MLVIGILRERMAYWPFVDCLDRMKVDLTANDVEWRTAGTRATNIYKGRESIVNEFLDSPHATHLLFVDSDETFPPQIARYLMALDLPVVSGLVFKRGWPHEPCIYRRVGIEESLSLAKEIKEWYVKYNVPVSNQPAILPLPFQVGVWEIDECGTGCMMIKREVIEAIEPPRFRGMGDVGTDLAFCRRVREAGFPIYVDLRVQLGHLVDYQVTAVDYGRIEEWIPILPDGTKICDEGQEDE